MYMRPPKIPEVSSSPQHNSSLGSKLKQFYLERDITLKDLAALIGGGIAADTVRRAMNGSHLTPRVRYKLERFLERVRAA